MKGFKLKQLKIHQIHINGIHLDILQKQGQGLTRHIGELFPDLSETSSWLGGDGEAWERGPYYIDGLIPLAFLLEDDELIAMANKWIDSILSSQDESGFFGPKSNFDWWPRAVVLKALASYYRATDDSRVIPFAEKYFQYMNEHIENYPFDFWGYARGLEGKELLDLLDGELIHASSKSIILRWKENTFDWKHFFEKFPFVHPTTRYLNKTIFNLIRPIAMWMDQISKKRQKPKIKTKENILHSRDNQLTNTYLSTHGVNIAMAFKYLIYLQEEEVSSDSSMFLAIEEVLKYHGNALNLFSSDEHLNGFLPEQGIELCVVVEMMYSMSEAMRLSKSMRAADYLEYYAYNALLTTITPDFTAHQYLQQVNQRDCSLKKHSFYDAGKESLTFGVAPNFGCCAANMHQGWPKMMSSAIMNTDQEIYVFLYVSGEFTIHFPEGDITIAIQTLYPFEDAVIIKCLRSSVANPKDILFRIPYRANTKMTINNHSFLIKDKEVYRYQNLNLQDEIRLEFAFKTETFFNQDHSFSVRRGPLLFAYPIQSREISLKGTPPFHDRGFIKDDTSECHPVLFHEQIHNVEMKRTLNKNAFHQNTIELSCDGIDISTGERKRTTLIPYGQTILRIAHFTRREFNE